MQYNRFLIGLGVVLFFGACTSEVTVDPDRLGYQYFPMEIGNYRIYDVEETNFFLTGDQYRHFQLKETVIDDSVISSTHTKYIVHRSSRLTENEEWHLDSVWSVTKSNSYAMVAENNISIVKLVFPIEEGVTWNGNSYNIRPEEVYTYDHSLKDTVLFDQSYDDLWKVIQTNREEDFLGRNEQFEIYAPNVGLIVKNSIIWRYCQSDCSEINQKVGGRELWQTLIEYGKE